MEKHQYTSIRIEQSLNLGTDYVIMANCLTTEARQLLLWSTFTWGTFTWGTWAASWYPLHCLLILSLVALHWETISSTYQVSPTNYFTVCESVTEVSNGRQW